MNVNLPNHKKNSSGFTLLELLVAFGIIGVLTVIGFTSFTSYSRRQVLDQAATKVKGAIDEAKFNAISKVKPQFCGNNSLSGYEFSLCSEDENCAYKVIAQCESIDPDNSDSQILSENIPDSVNIDPEETTCTTIYYNIINGFQADEPSGCQISLQAFSMQRIIVIDSGGNTSIR